jgi:hypothetical protein
MNPLNNVINWEFLDEPLYRWALFFLAVAGMGVAWRGVLELMH